LHLTLKVYISTKNSGLFTTFLCTKLLNITIFLYLKIDQKQFSTINQSQITVFLESVEAAPSKALQSKNAPGKSRAAKSKSKKALKKRKNKGRKRNGEEEGGDLEDPEADIDDEFPEEDEDDEGGNCMQCFDP
jgi:hypothetical protein